MVKFFYVHVMSLQNPTANVHPFFLPMSFAGDAVPQLVRRGDRERHRV